MLKILSQKQKKELNMKHGKGHIGTKIQGNTQDIVNHKQTNSR